MLNWLVFAALHYNEIDFSTTTVFPSLSELL